MVRAWPLVGRREELALVADQLRRGASSGVVVAGAAGVGKTRFATEVMLAAERERCATAWSTATTAAATIPFGALAHLLPVPVSGATGPLDLLRSAGRALEERAGGRRLMLAIDDAHLLDAASAVFTHQLASTTTAFVVATIRSGAPVRDPILALWKDGLTHYVELQPLAEAEARQLLALALDGEVESATMLRLWEATRGNALFLRELVTEGLDRHMLTAATGVWRWTGALAPGARLAEIVQMRIGTLAAAERDALELVALAEPLGASLVDRLVPRGGLERLQRRGVVTLERSDRRVNVRLVHPLYGEVLRGPTLPRRALAARLAGALADAGARRREDLLRLATWRLDGGLTGAPGLLAAAAHRAWASSDPILAARLATAAVDAGGGFEARYALALALRAQEHFLEADELLADLAPDARDRHERVRVADARAAGLWGRGMSAEAAKLLLDAEAEASERDTRDELAASRATVLAFSGQTTACLAVARPILARPAAGDRPRLRAGLAAVIALCLTGGADEAHALVTELRESALRLSDELPFVAGQLLAAHTLALALAGHLDDVHGEARAEYERALAERAHEPLELWALMLGRVMLGQGALPQARSLLQEAATLFAEADPIGLGTACLALLAQACAQAGDRVAAESALARATAAIRPGFHIFGADLGLARAWTAASEGDLSAAGREALSVADAAHAAGHYAYAALALHELARLGDAGTAAGRLRELVDTVDGPLIKIYAAHAEALAADDGSGLDRSGSAFETIGAQLLAAEAFAEASSTHRQQGRRASSARSATRAAGLLERCGNPRTPALASLTHIASLTRREREVASLAASGLSNQAIADRLVVSVRTVEHHLEHAYQKLGVNRRSELALHLGMPHADA